MQKIGGIWEDRDYICNKIEGIEELPQIDAKFGIWLKMWILCFFQSTLCGYTMQKKIKLVGVLGAKKTAKMFFIKCFAKLSLNFNSNLVWRWDVYILN